MPFREKMLSFLFKITILRPLPLHMSIFQSKCPFKRLSTRAVAAAEAQADRTMITTDVSI